MSQSLSLMSMGLLTSSEVILLMSANVCCESSQTYLSRE